MLLCCQSSAQALGFNIDVISNCVGAGVGVTTEWSSESFMQQRFRVVPSASAASGLAVFNAESGVRQYYLWPAVIVRVSEKWFVGGGAFYQRLNGDAAYSPIVTQRVDPNQWTIGVGAGYAWK